MLGWKLWIACLGMLVGCWSESGGCCVSLLIDGLLFRFGVLWVGCLRVCHIGGFGCVAVWWLLGLWVDVWWNASGCWVVWMGMVVQGKLFVLD